MRLLSLTIFQWNSTLTSELAKQKTKFRRLRHLHGLISCPITTLYSKLTKDNSEGCDNN
jgi:hypothetical protein